MSRKEKVIMFVPLGLLLLLLGSMVADRKIRLGESMALLVMIIGMLLLIVIAEWPIRYRASLAVRQWATANQVEIVDMRAKVFGCGPFKWRLNYHQVFELHITDSQGSRIVWARVNTYTGNVDIREDRS